MATTNNDSLWQRTKSGSKAGFDKLWGYADKLGAPVNRLSNRLGSESFWPTTLDKEADKAARILRSFCKDGFYKEETQKPVDGPTQKQRVLKKIPTEVIRDAKGLAIFTTMRTGLWVSGAGGSGIVVAKKPDGSWSPPVGIMLHTAGLGFLIGVDIYDCVLVLNTDEALEAFTRVRCTIGGEISAVAGPVGAGGVIDSEVHTRRAPIFTYLKSRGFYAGVQIDGTVIIERTDENERFYGTKLSAKQILSGAPYSPVSLRGLTATLKAAQGDNSDLDLMPNEPPPADFEIVQDGHVFGIPDKEDPDPFGVAALSKEGLEVKDATTHTRAADSEFEFKPKQDSPAYAIINRRESASMSPRREAFGSPNHRRIGSADHATQTDLPLHGPSNSSDTNVVQSPIQLEDRETKDGAFASSHRDSLEDVSLTETHEPVAKPPLPKRGPPPKLPPRNSLSSPINKPEISEPETTQTEASSAEKVEPKVDSTEPEAVKATEVEASESKVTETETPAPNVSEAKIPELKLAETEVSEAKVPETEAVATEAAETKDSQAKS